MTWIYKVATALTISEADKEMKEHGEKGWELVSVAVLPYTTTNTRELYFKKPVPPSSRILPYSTTVDEDGEPR
jgi:hypothetical protein